MSKRDEIRARRRGPAIDPDATDDTIVPTSPAVTSSPAEAPRLPVLTAVPDTPLSGVEAPEAHSEQAASAPVVTDVVPPNDPPTPSVTPPATPPAPAETKAEPDIEPVTKTEQAPTRPTVVDPPQRTVTKTAPTRLQKSIPPTVEVASAKPQAEQTSWARAALADSYRSATRRNSNDWVNSSISMEKSVKRRLEVRRATDSRKFGRKFAETHYINAAFKSRPRDLDVLTQITDAYLDSRGDSLYRARGQTTRLEPEVAQEMGDLAIDIREQVAYGFIGKVQSALVSLLLDALDQIDQVADGSVQDLDRLST